MNLQTNALNNLKRNKMKNKETLEEAAEKLYPKDLMWGMDLNEEPRKAMLNGANWQAERSYSEEDLKKAYFSAIESTGEGWNGEYAEGNNPNIEDKFSEGFNEFIEQFKKK